MQTSFYSMAFAFAAFSWVVPAITPVAAQTSAVAAHGRDNVSEPAARARRTRSIRAPFREMAHCAPDDRKCEVERKLKGTVYDPLSPRRPRDRSVPPPRF
jgi:hypothetical protein